MRTTLILVITILISLPATGDSNSQQQGAKTAISPSLVLSPCNIEGTSEKVMCGTYPVFEDRNAKKDVKSPLRWLCFLLPVRSAHLIPSFTFRAAQGRQQPKCSCMSRRSLPKIREHREIVVCRSEGSGGSHPLNCKFFNESDTPKLPRLLFPA